MCDDKYFKFIKNDHLFQYSLFVKSIDQICILFENKMPLHFQSRSQFASKNGKIFAQYLPFLHFLSVWYWTFICKVNTFLDGFHHGFIRTVKDVLNSLKKKLIGSEFILEPWNHKEIYRKCGKIRSFVW